MRELARISPWKVVDHYCSQIMLAHNITMDKCTQPTNTKWRLAKSASMKLKLGIVINLMLTMKQREKACPCL